MFDSGIHLPAENGMVPFALHREMGEAAANVMLQTGHENKTGSELYTFEEIAQMLSQLSVEKVTYAIPDTKTFEEMLRSAGVPQFGVATLTGFITDMKMEDTRCYAMTLKCS